MDNDKMVRASWRELEAPDYWFLAGALFLVGMNVAGFIFYMFFS